MESNQLKNPDSDKILWKKIFAKENLSEKVRKLKRNDNCSWVFVVFGIAMSIIAIPAYSPLFTSSSFQLGAAFLFIMGPAIMFAAAITLWDSHSFQRGFGILKQWYSLEGLAAYEESATITGHTISFKSAHNVIQSDQFREENWVKMVQDTWSFDVNHLHLIWFQKSFKKYKLRFYLQRPPSSQGNKPTDLVQYYRGGGTGTDHGIYLTWDRYELNKDELNSVLLIITTVAPHVTVESDSLVTDLARAI